MISSRLSRSRVCLALLLSLLVGAGLYFRLVYLETISLHVDEFISLLAVRGILEHGYPLLPSGTLYEQGLLFSYLEAFVLRVFGFDATVGRSLSLVLSVATIPVLYYVGMKLFSAQVGIVAATLQALSAQSIAWGARVRMYALLQLLVLLTIWFLWRGAVQNDGARYRWLSILCYLGALFTHPVSALLFVPLLLGVVAVKGSRSLLRPSLVPELVVPVGGIIATLVLKMVGQPGQLEALAEARPYLAPSLDVVGGFRPIAPFFVSVERMPLTILALTGSAIVVGAVIGSFRDRTSEEVIPVHVRASVFLYTILGAIVLEMVFLVGPTWRDSRYLFMVAPVFFLVASWTAVFIFAWLSERLQQLRPSWLWTGSPRQSISWALTCVLIAAAFLVSVPAAHAVVSNQEWGYDLAFEYMRQEWRQGDTVLTIVPFACDLYLPDCDYYASGKAYEEYVFVRDGILIDRWTGVPLLKSASELGQVLGDSQRVWFVVDGWRLAARFDLDFIRTVVEGMEVVHEVQGVRVMLSEGHRPSVEPEISKAADINFADQITLVGYDVSSATVESGGELVVTLHWEALRPIDDEYTVFVHLRGQSGSVVAQDDFPPLKNLYPTNYWIAGETVPDPRRLSVSTEAPPGRYRLEVGLYLPQTQERLAIVGEEGRSSTDIAILDFVQIGEALEESEPSHHTGANLGDKVLLTGHDGVPALLEPGQDIHLAVYWEALSRMQEDYTVFIHVVDAEGQPVAQHDGQPLTGFYPTSFWKQGEVVRDEYVVRLDPGVPGGEYELVAGMYLLSTGDRLTVLDADGQPIGDQVSLARVVLVER
jgi:hypothetical protein